ncbi:MAG: chemotaxis protein CheD [Gemmatimonadales bacterium]
MNGRDLLVRVADLNVGGEGDALVTVGLGSCVAIVLHDAVVRVGGMAHVLLPSPALSRQDNPAKCPQTAVPALLERMAQRGASPRRITARIAGGASMFAGLTPPGTVQMGERNVVAARETLREIGLPLVGEDVGADYGRTVRFRVADGRMEISSVMHGLRTL